MSAQRDKRAYVLERYVQSEQFEMKVYSSHQKACSATPFPHKSDWVSLGDMVFYHGSDDGSLYKITKARIR